MRRAKRSTQFPDKFRTKIDGLLFSGYIATRDTHLYIVNTNIISIVVMQSNLLMRWPWICLFKNTQSPEKIPLVYYFTFLQKYLSWITCMLSPFWTNVTPSSKLERILLQKISESLQPSTCRLSRDVIALADLEGGEGGARTPPPPKISKVQRLGYIIYLGQFVSHN